MNRLFRNTFFVTLSQIWQMLMALIMMPAAARFLGVEKYGSYTTATAIMFFVFLINDFGLNTWITRELARDKKQTLRLLSYAMGAKIFMIVPCLLFILAYFFLTDYNSQTYYAILIFAVYGVIDSFTQLHYAIFRSYERMELETLVATTVKTMLTVLAVLSLVLGWGLLPFCAMFVLSTVVGLFFSLVLVRKNFVAATARFELTTSCSMVRQSAWFGLALFVASSYDKIDVLMLSWMKGMEVVGLYGAASKLLSLTNLIPTIFATAFFPQMARFVSNKQELARLFSMAVKYLLMLAIPLVAGVYMLSDQLILLIGGREYAASAEPLRVIAFASGILFINIFLASLYGATNHQAKIVQIEIIALVFKTTLNLFLIPKYSYMGTAISTLANESLVFMLAMGWALRRIAPITEWNFVPKFLLSTAAMVACLLFLKPWPLPALITAAVCVYFIMLFITRTLDLRQIKSILVQR